MVGILFSFWDGLFSGAKMLVSGRVKLEKHKLHHQISDPNFCKFMLIHVDSRFMVVIVGCEITCVGFSADLTKK